MRATVVLVNGSAVERRRLAEIAQAAGHRVVFATAEKVLRNFAPPPRTVLVIDCGNQEMPPPYSLIDALHERGVYLPTLVTVAPYGIKDAVNAMRREVSDVLEQPLGASRFLLSVDAALQKGRRLGRPGSESW